MQAAQESLSLKEEKALRTIKLWLEGIIEERRMTVRVFINIVGREDIDWIKEKIEYSGHQINWRNFPGCSNNQYTPLIAAVFRRNKKVVEMLLEAGANPDVKDVYGFNALSYVYSDAKLMRQRMVGKPLLEWTKYVDNMNGIIDLLLAKSKTKEKYVGHIMY